MARIKMVDEADAEGPLAELYAAAKSRSVAKVVPDILRTMSLRPDFLTAIDSASRLHFSDGALTRAQHEMIASYVSALNRCRYGEVAQALRDGDLDAAGLDQAHRLLLDFVETITRHAYRVTDEQVQRLRDAGWTDEQIAEAAYDAALFNLFVRLADTFGIEPPAVYEPDGIPAAARPE